MSRFWRQNCVNAWPPQVAKRRSLDRYVKLDLFGPHFKANPYPTYATMRQAMPVYRRDAANGKSIWFITRYDDVAALLRDHTHFVKDVRNTMTPMERAQLPPTPPLVNLLSNHMLNLDPPDHTRLRTLVNKAFTAAVVQQMAGRVQDIADDLLDRVQARGRMDLIEDFAFPLPMTVIAELLGIPARDRARFRRWSDAFVTPSVNLQRSTKKYLKTRRLMEDFTGYLRQVFADRRQRPHNDLISSLLAVEEAGDRLSEEELFSMMILLVVAGHETVVNLIGNGVLALLQHPAQLDRLRQQPGLIRNAVEESLRYDGPVERATMRFAAEDVAVGGQTIRRGDAVSLVLAAADRDPAHFEHPNRFDLTRSNMRHLGFGLGIHYCLGAPLARLEGEIAFATLIRRLPDLRLAVAPEALVWRGVPILRGVTGLPVHWNAGSV
ncbi:MAG: cytochrome P450 [Chloroflexi bacterium]|nr:MAG: cytochrome P450 [Chloroflexota bacterium]